MNAIEKFFRKLTQKDRLQIEAALQQLFARDLIGLNLQRLKGFHHLYRIRVGNYRIIYFDDGQEIWVKAIKKRDESTYHNL